MIPQTAGSRHAALWLIGPDMPGLLKLGAEFVSVRGGNIDKDIADKFGEKAVVFMSVTADPKAIERMSRDTDMLKSASGCGVVFQAMNEPTVPPGYQPDLHGFDVVVDDAPGLIAAFTRLMEKHGMLILGHTGERRLVPGLRPLVQAGQKFVLMLPEAFDAAAFTLDLNALVQKHHGVVVAPLRSVPGLLWWW
jgi:glycine cleavage system regulatory protein